MLRRQRVRRTRSGSIKVDIPAPEQEVLRHVLPQLRDLLTLGSSDDRTRRLFPTAYANDPEAEAEYVGYMRDELVGLRGSPRSRSSSRPSSERDLTEEQAIAWLQSINSVRLVLGSLLDVSEELDINALPDDDPEIEGYVLYGYLSMLLDELVDALEPLSRGVRRARLGRSTGATTRPHVAAGRPLLDSSCPSASSSHAPIV